MKTATRHEVRRYLCQSVICFRFSRWGRSRVCVAACEGSWRRRLLAWTGRRALGQEAVTSCTGRWMGTARAGGRPRASPPAICRPPHGAASSLARTHPVADAWTPGSGNLRWTVLLNVEAIIGPPKHFFFRAWCFKILSCQSKVY